MALPWANSLDPIVVQLNYIWALAFLLLTLWLIFTRPMSSRRWLWYLPVAFVSGCGHEIIGLPVLIGLLVWLTCVRTSPLSPVKKWILAALALGCIFSVSSPGSYARLLSMESPGIQVPVWQHLITAAWLGWLLLLDFALLAIFRRSRLKQLCHTLWSPLAAISIASMVFLPVSYVPRAGIAVQLFALAAFARQFDFQLSRATSCLCAWALSLLMALQWSGAILWQWRVDTGTRLIMQEFHSNPRRPISGSFTTEVPCWLGGKATSNPIVCIPWNQACISRTYGFPILLQPCPANKEQGLQPCPENEPHPPHPRPSLACSGCHGPGSAAAYPANAPRGR